VILDGIRVIELSIAWAGPLAGRYLADLGAEVIKVEHPTARGAGLSAVAGIDIAADIGDWQWGKLPGPIFRPAIFPDADPGDEPWNRQGVYNKMNRNKRSLAVDLKAPEGWDVFRRLVARSDIVLNNYSPRGVRSLGIGYEALREMNPKIIAIGLSGYGATGPDQDRVSWGPMLEAHSGLAATTGYRDGGPVKMGAALPDPVGGTHCAFAALAALSERDRTGEGMFLDISQLETYASMGGELFLAASVTGDAPTRMANRSERFAPQGVFPCIGDDAWVAISVTSDEEWERLVAVIDDAALRDPAFTSVATRFTRHDELDAHIAEWTASRDKFEIMHQLQGAGVTAGASFTNRDLVEDAHLAARGFIVEWDQPTVGPRRYAGFPIHLSRTGPVAMRPTPLLGQDNRYVVGDVLGLASEDIDALEAKGIIANAPP
jgi:crotonobetainyl-CoA:carnitine CoA-transferase CaiB-like acyl-CoA transferase